MKIKYAFANETVTIEVEDQWATVLVDLDRQEYNIDQKETRRHCSLEAYDLDHNLLASDEDIACDFIQKADKQELHAAIGQLKPAHRDLVYALFFDGVSNEEYARRCGVTPGAITQRKNTALKKLKKILEKT